MLDNDFERNKNILKAKLPEYLKSKGINIDKNFRCLNPEHRDVNPSMGYNRNNETVHCFSCNATYDIFKLVGIDYSLHSFLDQYNKLKQMYNIDFRSTPDSSEIQTSTATFGVKRDNTIIRENPSAFTASPVNFHALANDPNIDARMLASDKVNFPPLNKPQNGEGFSQTVPFNDMHGFKVANEDNFMPGNSNADGPQIGNAVFGKRTVGAVPLNQGGNFNQPQFNAHNFNSFPQETRVSYKEYIEQCHRNVDATDYFKMRGISQNVIDRFNLGYDMRFEVGPDSISHESYIWRAAIIPNGEFSYMARNTDPNAKDRIRKKGHQGIFNIKALDREGAIFITEGEFDALSLETLGFPAIALGGASNTQPLIDYVQEHNIANRIFYIALDNDEAGDQCAKTIASAFMQMHVAFKRVNISFPYKDPNEALIKDRQNLLYRLEHIEEILSFTLQGVIPPNGNLRLIYDNDSLSRLSLSPMLYSMTGEAVALRNTICSIIENKMARIIYAGNFNQWQLLCNLFRVEQNEMGQMQYSTWHNASFIEIDKPEELIQSLKHAVTACKIQSITEFTLVTDLTCYSRDEVAKILPSLGHLGSQSEIAIIALLPHDYLSLANANALQNLDVTISSNGYELLFRSRDLQGRSIEFTRYSGA